MSTSLRDVLHLIVDKLAFASQSERDSFHELLDEAWDGEVAASQQPPDGVATITDSTPIDSGAADAGGSAGDAGTSTTGDGSGSQDAGQPPAEAPAVQSTSAAPVTPLLAAVPPR